MKKLALALLLAAPITAMAAWVGPGTNAVSSAAAVATAADDSAVKLEGQIVRQISGDKYEFKDASGSVTVEISHKLWPAKEVVPANVVRLTGEVDKGMTSREVDVKTLEVIK